MIPLSKNKNKWIKSLRLKKNRDLEDCFVVEGEKMITEIIEHWSDSILLICTVDSSFNFQDKTFIIGKDEMNQLTSHATTPTVLAVIKKPSPTAKNEDFILVLDRIQDPGNMGTIIRTADWFGVDKIICSKTTVDAFNSKVIQSSMGSLFRVPIEYCDLSEYLSNSKLPIYGALLNGENLYQKELPSKAIIVIGNEGNGISDEIIKKIEAPILIPAVGKTESLNASIATAIILAEFRRSSFQQ